MKYHILIICIILFNSWDAPAQNKWQIQPLELPTRWTMSVTPQNALIEYPRPQMKRKQWQNLNGLWDYTISALNDSLDLIKFSGVELHEKYSGQILVPYPIESSLSGVKKQLLPDQILWYKRSFSYNSKPGQNVLLHFGAVDNVATVYLNGKEVGRHYGGYTSFTVDLSSVVQNGDNELVIRVTDPTDEGIYPHGKQVLKPANIYYTSTSGIWQTVWLEVVPQVYVSDLKMTPDINKGELKLRIVLNESIKLMDGYSLEVQVPSIADNIEDQIRSIADSHKRRKHNQIKKKKQTVGRHSIIAHAIVLNPKFQNELQLKIPRAKLWTPSYPYLYDLIISLKKDGKIIDEVKSYFGMRKVSIQKDVNGVDRIFLNNKTYYNLGVLDQGYWPDGLYTAPTDSALAFDIQATKAMGFNTIRKHMKVEPARWYYHADRIGMLVWQDLVSPNQGLPQGSKVAFEDQSREIIEQLHNYPCITTWVLFNEKWGQYDQARLTKWIKQLDSTRLINGHSGEYLYVDEKLRSPSPSAYVNSNMTDVHSYPNPRMPLKQFEKAQVLGEFGGIGTFISDHQWNSSNAWGYLTEKPADLKVRYQIMNQHLRLLQRGGLSGSIYTQTYDIEGEQNGLMTYDREVVKVPFEELCKIHAALNPERGYIPKLNMKKVDLTDPAISYSTLLNAYIQGKREFSFLILMAVQAAQTGDQDGLNRVIKDILPLLTRPYKKKEIIIVLHATIGTKSPGFFFLQVHANELDSLLGKRLVSNKLMGLIYNDEIKPFVIDNLDTNWAHIALQIKPYGNLGEEMYLRAKSLFYLKNKNWNKYRHTVDTYLKHYGSFLTLKEIYVLQKALSEHL
jgi:hypothetical protein